MATLYEKLGGQGAVSATIAKMYEKILGDERVSIYFSDVDIKKLRCMTAEFVSMAFGAPSKYTGKSLRDAHTKLVEKDGLNDKHFDIVIEHLTRAMQELEVAPDLIKEGIAIVESVRKDVLNK